MPYQDHSYDSYLGLVDAAFVDMPATERWRYFRQLIWKRDQGQCGLCGGAVLLDRFMHIDHIVQHHAGGATTWSNLRVTHARCNQIRPRGKIQRSERIRSRRMA